MEPVMERKERFRLVRECLGQSHRGMAILLQGSPALWTQYESGRKCPSFEALERLAALGVNVDWIVTGRGKVFFNDRVPTPADTVKGFDRILKALELTLHEHDVERFDLWDRIVSVLSSVSEGMTIEEIGHRLALSPDDPNLLTQLRLLEQERVIGVGRGGYRLIRSSYLHNTNGVELQILLAARDLFGTIAPAIRANMMGGKLLRTADVIFSGQVEELLHDLVVRARRLSKASATIPGTGTTRVLRLVLAYSVTE